MERKCQGYNRECIYDLALLCSPSCHISFFLYLFVYIYTKKRNDLRQTKPKRNKNILTFTSTPKKSEKRQNNYQLHFKSLGFMIFSSQKHFIIFFEFIGISLRGDNGHCITPWVFRATSQPPPTPATPPPLRLVRDDVFVSFVMICFSASIFSDI